MSKNLSKAKRGTGSWFPERAIDAQSGVGRVEPILTGSDLRRRFFFGVPLRSPMTNESITDADLDEYVMRAFNQIEMDTDVDIAPVIRRHRLPFDPNLYQSFIYCEIPHKPIQKVIRMAICSANYIYTGEPNESSQFPTGGELYTIPNEWIEMGQAVRGILNVNPLNPAFTAIGTGQAAASSGAILLQSISGQGWTPSYWTVECLHGYCTEEGNVPVIINELLGQKAAMILIENVLPLFKNASQSMGIDGLSQSVNDITYQLLQQKYTMLQEAYGKGLSKIKAKTANGVKISNI